ncbi:response regulator transcription factor [Abyssisolibacter fermentans]|uniref:response regulator transcription factor n=1 Tax=Abyssisolibacter fermentans TaxID=1766203 RepID=UPI000A55B624|nr:response regulator transcription factor [Abyssisolibacter fermentans]
MYEIKILLVEDNDRIREIIRKYLERESFVLFEASTGEEALKKLAEREYHLIVLDIMLPDKDGWTILRHIRESMDVPVIMLTARSEEEDKLFGFELGADDYITKPFSSRLLVARIKALLKRNHVLSANNEIIINQIRINKDFRQAYIDDEKIDLTPIEYSLLLYFVDNINIALSRAKILDAVWGFDYFGDERTVDTHVKRLRKKLGRKNRCIETVRGLGYRMVKE